MPPRPGEVVRRATGDERAQALYFDQMDRKVPVGAGPRRRRRSTSTWSSWTAPAARTCRSAASPASRPRPASRCSCCTRSSVRGAARARAQREGAGVQRQGRGPAVPRPAQRRLDDDLRGRLRAARAARRAVRRPSAFYAPPTPDDLTGRPHVTGRTSGVERVLVDARRVLRRRAAAVRVRRRRGRAQPVHDGRPPGRRPAARGTPRRRRGRRGRHRRATPAAPTTSWSTFIVERLTDDATPDRTGPGRSPGRAPSTRSCAGCGPAAAAAPI